MSNEVANTILQQLGGNRFAVMTGSKNFLADGQSLRFNVGRNSRSINFVRVTLNTNDLYDVEFSFLRAGKLSLRASESDVFCGDLRRVFTDKTGLYTSL